MTIVERVDELKVGQQALAFWGLGQVGIVVKGPTGVIYVDPYLTASDGAGGRLERTFPPPISPDQVTNADAILLTHNHIDHTDPRTILPISVNSPKAHFVAPFTSRDALVEAGLESGRISVPETNQPLEIAGATVTAIPSAHTELEFNPGRGHPYLGYILEWNDVTVYHAGDTIIYDGLVETLGRWHIDIAFIPINGRDYFRTAQGIIGNTNYREAVELAETLNFSLTVPTHYDLLAFNAADPGHFVSYLYQLNPMRQHKILRPGELLYFAKENG